MNLGLAVALLGLAAGLLLPADVTLAQWADENRKVVLESGSPYPGDWSYDPVPYGVQIQECLSFSHTTREATFVKSNQVGGSEFGINLFGFVVDKAPSPVMFVLPPVEKAGKY